MLLSRVFHNCKFLLNKSHYHYKQKLPLNLQQLTLHTSLSCHQRLYSVQFISSASNFLHQQSCVKTVYSSSKSNVLGGIHFSCVSKAENSSSRQLFTSVPNCKKATAKRVTPLDDGYSPVYKFPYIKAAHILCRMKIYQTAGTLLLVPAYCMVASDALTSLQFWAAFGCAGLATVMLGVMGEMFRKFVGIIYYKPENNTICVSHLTFWGRRKDEYFEVEDVVSLHDVEHNFADIYLNMRFYSDPKKVFWISLKFGEVIDRKLFSEVFCCSLSH